MAKLVRYNGEKVSYKGCDSPTNLVKGKVYEVQFEEDLGWQTNYKLKGLNGNFNSVWFNEVEIPVVMALSHKHPELHKPLENLLMFNKNEVRQVLKTTPVQKIEKVEGNVFKILTKNTIYIIQVVS
jgi:hypothetical protein